MFKGINWIAVVVAIVLVQVLGFLWYGPVFGATWHKLDPTAPMGGGFDAKMACGVLLTAILVIGMAWLFARMAVADLMGGMKTALIVCVAFVLTLVAMGYCYEGQPVNLVLFNAGYELIAYLIAGAVLGLMRPRRPDCDALPASGEGVSGSRARRSHSPAGRISLAIFRI